MSRSFETGINIYFSHQAHLFHNKSFSSSNWLLPSSKGSLCLVFVAVYSFSSTSRFPSSFTEDRMCRYESQFLSFIMIHYFCLLLCMRYVRLYTWMRLILCIQQRVMFNYRKYIAMQLRILNEHPTLLNEHVSAIFV